MTFVLAHPTHWLLNVVYVAPLLVLAVAMLVLTVRDRRRRRREASPPAP